MNDRSRIDAESRCIVPKLPDKKVEMPRYRVPLYRKDDPSSLPDARYVFVEAETAELARLKALKRRSKWIAGRSEFYAVVPDRNKGMDFWLLLFVLFTILGIVMMIVDPAPDDESGSECTLRGCQ